MNSDTAEAATDTTSAPDEFSTMLAIRCAIGGVLMGLANLVPGISGGTMLVASGIYTRFIDAISDITRFRFTIESICVLAFVVASAGVAIILLAGAIASLMIDARWIMYSIFIGLTWGSVPLLIAMARPTAKSVWIGAGVGVFGMVSLAYVQSAGGSILGDSNMFLLFVAGIAGASAMILPGVSGAYLLLLLGQYLPILESIHRFKEAAFSFDVGGVLREAGIVIPVGLGVVVGIVGVSNLLRWLLHRFEKVTLGVLLGLVIGAPAGLYPFQRGIEPVVGDEIRGIELTEANIEKFLEEPSKWDEQIFSPSLAQAGAALGLVLLGAGATLAISYLGRDKRAAAISHFEGD